MCQKHPATICEPLCTLPCSHNLAAALHSQINGQAADTDALEEKNQSVANAASGLLRFPIPHAMPMMDFKLNILWVAMASADDVQRRTVKTDDNNAEFIRV
jgi:hypothetical protein